MTITVYSKDHCMQCTMTLRQFDQHQIPVIHEDITEEANTEKAMSLGHRQAPVIIVTDDDGTMIDHWSGFNPDKIRAYSHD